MDPVTIASSVIAAQDLTVKLARATQRLSERDKRFRELHSSLRTALAVLNYLVSLTWNDSQAFSSENYAHIAAALVRYVDNLRKVESDLGKINETNNRPLQQLRFNENKCKQWVDAINLSIKDLRDRLLGIELFRVSTVKRVEKVTQSVASTVNYSEVVPSLEIDIYLNSLRPRQRQFYHRTKFVPTQNSFIILPVADDAVVAGSSNTLLALRTLEDDFDPVLESFSSEPTVPQTSASTPPNAGPEVMSMHLIVCSTSSRTISKGAVSFSEESYIKLMTRLHFSGEFLVALLTGTPLMLSTDHLANVKGARSTFVMRTPLSNSNNWTLALCWDHQKRATYALLHGLQEGERTSLLSALEEFKSVPAHPLLLPVLLCELLTESDSNAIKAHAATLYGVEIRTNYLRFDKFKEYGEAPDAKTPEEDFEDLTRKLNALTSRFAFHEMRVNANVTLTSAVLSHIKASVGILGDGTGSDPDTWPTSCKILSQRLQNLQVEHAALLVEINCNQKITAGQLQIVYNLIAQRDNLENFRMASISTRIAAITKEDSYAMRTIAVMTVSFLPATAISSLFSMTMFNWQAAEGSSVVSGKFWIYWVVAVPLTIVVMSIWFLWMRIHQKSEDEFSPTAEISSILSDSTTKGEGEDQTQSEGRIPRLRRRALHKGRDDEKDLESDSHPQNGAFLKSFEEAQPVRTDTFAQGPRR